MAAETVSFALQPEVCCEECGEVHHNHFDCPACGKKEAPSSLYEDYFGSPRPLIIGCELCGAEFYLADDGADCHQDTCEWVQIRMDKPKEPDQ